MKEFAPLLGVQVLTAFASGKVSCHEPLHVIMVKSFDELKSRCALETLGSKNVLTSSLVDCVVGLHSIAIGVSGCQGR